LKPASSRDSVYLSLFFQLFCSFLTMPLLQSQLKSLLMELIHVPSMLDGKDCWDRRSNSISAGFVGSVQVFLHHPTVYLVI
jgi:hypothetical protein